MEAVIIILLCAVGFVLYLLNNSKNELLRLKEQIHERDIQILKLQTALRERNVDVSEAISAEIQTEFSSSAVDNKAFVQVIFKKDSKKRYDYLLGKNYDVKVGDFVEVYASGVDNGKPKWAVAEVVYISSPGETSDYAKSAIKRKSNHKKW